MPTPGMDRPPLPSPDIQAQMGQPPPQEPGLSAITQPGPGAGGPNPHGFLLAQVDAVKKVLEQISGAEPAFAPFANKALATLDEGVSAVSTAPRAQEPVPPVMQGGPPSGPGMGGGPPLG